jgi:hypothetical protein
MLKSRKQGTYFIFQIFINQSPDTWVIARLQMNYEVRQGIMNPFYSCRLVQIKENLLKPHENNSFGMNCTTVYRLKVQTICRSASVTEETENAETRSAPIVLLHHISQICQLCETAPAYPEVNCSTHLSHGPRFSFNSTKYRNINILS